MAFGRFNDSTGITRKDLHFEMALRKDDTIGYAVRDCSYRRCDCGRTDSSDEREMSY
jgi:hypothetical protein